MKSINLTIPDFNLDKVYIYNFNNIEIRILCNIALCLGRISNKNKYNRLNKYLIENIDKKSDDFKIILYNYCVHLINLDKLYDAEKIIEETIKFYENKRVYKNIDKLYLLNGIINYKLNKTDYIKLFNKAIKIATIFEKNNLVKYYEQIIKYYTAK
ncbi:hypothetical protein [Helcococcus ovis]|uniref:hypothetical protein n=1 Tax=Helcococcus ovis TaxID=72026 RepID=UPI0038B7FF85